MRFARLAVLFLIAVGLRGQEYAFIGQTSCIPGLEQWAAIVKNAGDNSATIRAADVMVEAQKRGIQMATYTSVLRAVEDANRRSPVRYVLLSLEIAGWGMSAITALDTTDAEGHHTGPIQINDRWKALLPTGAAGVTALRYLLNREKRDVSLPSDMIPPLFTVLPGESVSYSIFGASR